MPFEQQKLYEATNLLSRYYGLYTARDLAGRLAMEQLQGNTGVNDSVANFDLEPPPAEITNIIAAIIDNSEGSFLISDLIHHLNSLISSASSATEDSSTILESRVNTIIKVIGPDIEQITNSQALFLNDIIGIQTGSPINLNTEPTKEFPHLSIVKLNDVRVTPTAKNINAITIFLNGIPTIELAKAVPYLNIEMMAPGSPIAMNGRLQNISLFRFLEGNAQVEQDGTGVRTTLALANRIVNTDFLEGQEATPENSTYTSTGMEMFTAPQTLVNGDESYGNPERVNPILDKFQPLMTLKSLDVEVRPSTGIMGFKTAKLNITVHDRSRLAEVAGFIRPDLYSRTEFLIEYGWNHPEATDSATSTGNNYYAELINAMRCREKYSIVNSSLTFQPGGLVDITLDLNMRGGSEASSESISTGENGNPSRILDQIRELSTLIGEYRSRMFGNQTEQGSTRPASREVRGIQILDTAQDAASNMVMTPEIFTNLRAFRTALSAQSNPTQAATDLRHALDQMYGTAPAPSPALSGSSGHSGTSSRSLSGGLISELRNSVQSSILQKMTRLGGGPAVDPLMVLIPDQNTINIPRRGREGHTGDRGDNGDSQLDAANVPEYVSLSKILAIFVGEPMAMTHKFDDIQMLFYPFNSGAGTAGRINIASFAVNTRYFYENYLRLRLENLSRSANMTIQEFLQFVASTILDDMANPSYGISNNRLARNMFQETALEGGGSSHEVRVDAVEQQSILERVMANVTPDGTFRMPQIDFYLECSPQRVTTEGGRTDTGNLKSILKIHIFDRHMTAYETESSLIAGAREDELQPLAQTPETDTEGDSGVPESQAIQASKVLSAARASNIIEQINGTNLYQIIGGTAELKRFLMRTMPYIIFGAQGTTIKQANITSIQDPALASVNMIRSFQTTTLDPSGQQPGSLPLQIIPCEASLSIFGCPLIDFAQQFFIDFQTGTSVDNIYSVMGITHHIAPGDFSTEVRMGYGDAWGTYRSLLQRVNTASQALNAAIDSSTTPATTPSP